MDVKEQDLTVGGMFVRKRGVSGMTPRFLACAIGGAVEPPA